MVSPTAELALGGSLQKSSSTKPKLVQDLVSKARAAQAVFENGDSWISLGIKGDEVVTIEGIGEELTPRKKMTMVVTSPDGTVKAVPLLCRIDTLDELDYFRNGGILPYVLRQLAA